RAQASGSRQATSTSAGAVPRVRSRTAPPTTYACVGTSRRRGKRRRRSSRSVISRPKPRQHRQECLCHIDPARLVRLLLNGRASVAKTLLSVLWHGDHDTTF